MLPCGSSNPAVIVAAGALPPPALAAASSNPTATIAALVIMRVIERIGTSSVARPDRLRAAERRCLLRARAAVLAIGRRADHGEVSVELDVDLAPVVERDLELVVAVLIADRGLGDPTAAGGGECRGSCAVVRTAVIGVSPASSPPAATNVAPPPIAAAASSGRTAASLRVVMRIICMPPSCP